MDKQFNLILFDLDGTLADRDSDRLYPDAINWFHDHPIQQWMIVTNQGGIGLRHWMETEGFGDPSKLPTLQDFERRLTSLFPMIHPEDRKWHVLMCARYQSKKSGLWCPVPPEGSAFAMWNQDWRKPAPGMLQHAMTIRGFSPEDTLMVGNSTEDMQAAQAAGCAFQEAWAFFGRPKPEEML